jgi:hypothetical protein
MRSAVSVLLLGLEALVLPIQVLVHPDEEGDRGSTNYQEF